MNQPPNSPPIVTDNEGFLLDPYTGLPADQVSRLNCNVSAADLMLIKAVSPIHGTIQKLLAIHVKSIANALRREGLTHYTPESHSHFINIVKLHANPGSTGQGPSVHDAGGAAGLHSAGANHPDKSADVQGKAGTGGKATGESAKKQGKRLGTKG